MSSNEIDAFTKNEIEKNPFLLPFKNSYVSNENTILKTNLKIVM